MAIGRNKVWKIGVLLGGALGFILGFFWKGGETLELLGDEPGMAKAYSQVLRIPGSPAFATEESTVSESLGEVKGIVLEERFLAGNERGKGKRVSLVEVEEFAFPIRVERSVEIDEVSGEERVLEILEMAADRVIVRIKEGIDALVVRENLAAAKARLGRRLVSADAYELIFEEATLDTVPEGMARLSEGEFGAALEYLEPNYVVHAALVPNDPRFEDGSLWGLNNTGKDGGVAGVDIDAPEGWDKRTSAAGIVVAVIDTGINYLHEDLAANLWVNELEIPDNGIDDDQNGFVDDVHGINAIRMDGDPMDDNGHGTHCSGTIGARGNNGVGVTGVAWDVRLMGLKFLSNSGSGTTADAIACIDYALTMGANLMSNSWGGSPYSQSLYDAIALANENGVAFVVAAGNAAMNIDEMATYPAAYELDNVVSVASVNRTGSLSGFSNYGLQNVDLAAPGSEILSTWIGGFSEYKTISGTSMATPHVSGILAMLMAEYPADELSENVGRLLYGAKVIPDLEDKVRVGGMASLARSLALVKVPKPPRFLRRPSSQVYEAEGMPLVLEAEVESEFPTTFQWFFENEILEGEIGNLLDLELLSLEKAGEYRLEVSNKDGTVNAVTRVVVLSPRLAMSEALDAPFFPVYSFGDADWEVYSFDSVVGATSLRSGRIDDGEDSSFFIDARGPGRVSFFWRVSSETFWDYGRFSVDGDTESELRRSSEWREYSIELREARAYRLQWNYLKDGSGVDGQDALFVDGLTFSPQGAGPPVILRQPQGAVLGTGATYFLSVEAVGEELEYQWLRDEVVIPGANSAALRVLASADGAAGAYAVQISNRFGVELSEVARIRIADIAASIEQQPRGVQASVGQRVEFEAKVAGSLPMALQWYRDGIPISGAREVRLVLDRVELEDAGTYVLRVSNEFTLEPLSTEGAQLSVTDVSLAPKIVKQPESGYWQSGERFRLSVAVEGTFPIAYQWFKDGVELIGETERFLLRESASLEDAGLYYVEAINALGTIRSQGVRVQILGDLSAGLDWEELDWSVEGEAYFYVQDLVTYDGHDALQSSVSTRFFGANTLLQTELTGPGTFSMYWKQDTGSPASSLSLYVDDKIAAQMNVKRDWHQVKAWVPEGRHLVRIAGSIEIGSTVWLDQSEWEEAPVLYGHSGSRVLTRGAPLRLWTDFRGKGELSYQWYRNGLPISGAVGNEYLISAVDWPDIGRYRVDAFSEFGEVHGPEMLVLLSDDLAGQVGDGTVDLELDRKDAWIGSLGSPGGVVLRSGTPGDGEKRELFGYLEGPGTLVFETGIRTVGCCPSLALIVDGMEVARYTDAVEGVEFAELKRRAVWVGEGQHLVEWRFAEGSGGPKGAREGFVRGIRITSDPVFAIHPKGLRLVEGQRARFGVEVVGEQAVTYRWFKDGVRLEGENAPTFEISSVSASDQGLYRCEVENEAGAIAQSDSAVLEVVADFYEAAEFDFGKLVGNGGVRWEPRLGGAKVGDSSLAFVASAAGALDFLSLRIDIPEDERRGLAFWIRTEGMLDDSSVRITENSGKRFDVTRDADWQRVVLPLAKGGDNRITVSVRKGSGVGRDTVEVYLDGFELVESPLFYEAPESAARFWGDSHEFGQDSTGRDPMTFQWFKDGAEVLEDAGESAKDARLRVRRVSDLTAGDYQLRLENAVGFKTSEAASLKVLGTGIGEAVGTPGTSVWSEGRTLWQVDASDGAVGERSLSTTGLKPQEASDLLFWIRGPGVLSLYWKLDSPSGNDRLSIFAGETQVSGLYASSDWERYELRVDGRFYQMSVRLSNVGLAGESEGRGWVDSIRFKNDGAIVYGDWAARVFSGSEISAVERALEADPDGDGLPNFVEYALRADPLEVGSMPVLRRMATGSSWQALVDFPLEGQADDVAFGLEISRDLHDWYPLRSQFAVTLEQDGFVGTLAYRLDDDETAGDVFLRMVVYYISDEE